MISNFLLLHNIPEGPMESIRRFSHTHKTEENIQKISQKKAISRSKTKTTGNINFTTWGMRYRVSIYDRRGGLCSRCVCIKFTTFSITQKGLTTFVDFGDFDCAVQISFAKKLLLKDKKSNSHDYLSIRTLIL